MCVSFRHNQDGTRKWLPWHPVLQRKADRSLQYPADILLHNGATQTSVRRFISAAHLEVCLLQRGRNAATLRGLTRPLHMTKFFFVLLLPPDLPSSIAMEMLATSRSFCRPLPLDLPFGKCSRPGFLDLALSSCHSYASITPR